MTFNINVSYDLFLINSTIDPNELLVLKHLFLQNETS